MVPCAARRRGTTLADTREVNTIMKVLTTVLKIIGYAIGQWVVRTAAKQSQVQYQRHGGKETAKAS
jgi:hypothetical protein